MEHVLRLWAAWTFLALVVMAAKRMNNEKRDLESWEKEIPRLLVPPQNSPYVVVDCEVAKVFPDDNASRWVLGLLAARNDLSISLKFNTPFMVAPQVENKAEALYRTSHAIYFWRLLIAQVAEAWVTFNRGRGGKDPLIAQIIGTERVQARHKQVLDAFGRKSPEGHSVGEFLERCRASTFHYYDDEGDEWAKQLELIKDEPFFIVPEAEKEKQVSCRYITADEWINSRLNAVGFGSSDFHKAQLVPAAFDVIKMIDDCSYEYLKVRKAKLKYGNSMDKLHSEEKKK